MGDCLENEQHDPETGMTLQTTTNGQLIWRKAANWTGFTDGERTWINGPEGLQQRLNSERFDWEAPMVSAMTTQRLTLEQLRNAEYLLPLVGEEHTPIRLEDGEGSIAYGEGATERVYAGIDNDTVAFGDLDGDGIADAAVVLFTSGGGSGTFKYLVAVLYRDGEPVQAARVYLGDRAPVRSLAISGGRIVAQTVTHRVRRRYMLSDAANHPRLRACATANSRSAEALVIESPLPGETVAGGVEVRGTTTVHPSSDGLRYLVYDARGGVIGMGVLPVEGFEGTPGTFAAPVEFISGASGPGRIEIVDAGDGSAVARTTVLVVLEATPSMYGAQPGEEMDRPARELVLEAPLSGATVGTEIEVRGRISEMPFEKNLTYRIYDEAGTVVGESYITVEGDLDGPGTFVRSIAVTGTDRSRDPSHRGQRCQRGGRVAIREHVGGGVVRGELTVRLGWFANRPHSLANRFSCQWISASGDLCRIRSN